MYMPYSTSSFSSLAITTILRPILYFKVDYGVLTVYEYWRIRGKVKALFRRKLDANLPDTHELHSQMLSLEKNDGLRPKCFFASSVLPSFVNHEQIPNKKKPFSTISGQAFSHTLDVVLPRAAASSLQEHFGAEGGTLQYARVHMKLSEVIEGDFFNQYIKIGRGLLQGSEHSTDDRAGNILMLSEGRPGIDHGFSLSEGVLRLEVDKATFERMGLDGSIIPSEGRKHVKARYSVELNLRLPSMVRGKKGFERIIWAFRNVLNQTVTWLFYDLGGETDGTGPIVAHQPEIKSVKPEHKIIGAVQVPPFPEDLQQHDHETATELLEWLSLATSSSPRVQQDDEIDPYLSRYQLPKASATTDRNLQDLVRLRWHGFVTPRFIREIFLATLKASGDSWFAFNATAFDGKAFAFLQNKHHTMTWEYMD
ncbi:hypothetical protein LTR37_000568 [Vermiconidia calcicola]|uniref:Uncharacterized protein n=1 Tax=Vermiconidia calcicola TaxID=1690605 RepID=A0ACC3NY11_9PEZI|nr:hypothetical protein LTR37_000568 [Vermiconidia calcicola]